MQRRYLISGLMLMAAVTGLGFLSFSQGNSVSAGKPDEVVQWSNGFPSGPHFNLNIHGKKDGFSCDSELGGGSVFVPEYGDSEIDYVQNRKSSVSELTVHDKCGTFDGDPALVQLPKGEYQVYARILAKPRKSGESREVVFYPKLVEACDVADTDAEAVDCESSFLAGSGVITSGGVFDLDKQELIRSKGKSTAVDVTDLFQWTGYSCDQIYDVDMDGDIDIDDLLMLGFPAGDLDGDLDIDGDDLHLYLVTNCDYLQNEWIFNIADLVVYGWDYQNNGSKLVQVRFYPVDTTEYSN